MNSEKIIAQTFVNLLDCSEEEAKIITREVVANLKKSSFSIQYEGESEIKSQ